VRTKRGGGAPGTEDEDEVLGDDSARLGDDLGVHEEEGEAARRFLALAWLGVDHSFVYVELRKVSMAARTGREENERGEEKRRREGQLGFERAARAVISAGLARTARIRAGRWRSSGGGGSFGRCPAYGEEEEAQGSSRTGIGLRLGRPKEVRKQEIRAEEEKRPKFPPAYFFC
jgi:hypothetical protein